jgi:hypothetical protein
MNIGIDDEDDLRGYWDGDRFRCCMDCDPDVNAKCRKKGCQVDKLVEQENRTVEQNKAKRNGKEVRCR